MNEWMDGWMNEGMDGWMNEWMDGWIEHGWMDASTAPQPSHEDSVLQCGQ